jgi:lactate racemase
MKIIQLAYGKTGCPLNLEEEWNAEIIQPFYESGLADAFAALRQAFEEPIASVGLRGRAAGKRRVGIIVNDITRATPTPLILAALLEQLADLPGLEITLFNALGTHRENSPDELRSMLGADLAGRLRIVQNNCTERSTQVCLGRNSLGHEVWINRELAACDLKILTGFIEPHFFAGFSGGGKAIMPGMASLDTILANHSAQNIAHPQATWGVTHGNPIWEEVHEVGLMAGDTFLVNVTLNRDKEITAVFAGDLTQAHAAGCEHVRQHAMAAVEAPFDIVVTSNSGYPLDLNLYQTVKGMSAAAQVVKEGGRILAVAECWDGIPEHGSFKDLLCDARSPRDLLARIHQPGFARQDQWQAQILAQILLKAQVSVYSQHLSDEQLRDAMLQPAGDPNQVLRQWVAEMGPGARICVMPEGPLSIPYIS